MWRMWSSVIWPRGSPGFCQAFSGALRWMSSQPRFTPMPTMVTERLLHMELVREEVWTLRRGRRTHVVTVEPDTSVLAAMGLNLMDGRRVHEVEERAYTLARHQLHDLPVGKALRQPA